MNDKDTLNLENCKDSNSLEYYKKTIKLWEFEFFKIFFSHGLLAFSFYNDSLKLDDRHSFIILLNFDLNTAKNL